MSRDWGQVEKMARRSLDIVRSLTESLSLHTSPLTYQHVLQEQCLDAGPQKRLKCLCRRIDDRLTLDVEARVEHHLPICQLSDGPEQLVEFGVACGRDRLHSGGAVDMGDGGQVGTVFLADIDIDD